MLLICTAACSVTKPIVSLLSKCKYRGGKKLNEKQLQTGCPEEFSLPSWNKNWRQKFCSASWWKSRSLSFLEIRGILSVVLQVSYMGWINYWIAWLNSRAGKIGHEFFRHMVVPCFGKHLWGISPVHSTTTKPSYYHFHAPTGKILSFTFHLCSQTAQLLSALQMAVHSNSGSREHSHNRDVVQSSINLYVKMYWVSIEAFQSSRNYASTTTQPSLLIIGQFAKLHGWSCS